MYNSDDLGVNIFEKFSKYDERGKEEMNILDFNKGMTARYTFERGGDFEYCNLEHLFETYGANEIFPVRALYINDSKFGEQPLVVTDNYNVNLPKHLLEDVRIIRECDNITEDINDGLVGFKVYRYENKTYGGYGYSINWVMKDVR